MSSRREPLKHTLEAILNYSQEGIVSVDRAWALEFVNPAAAILYGVASPEVIGEQAESALPNTALQQVLEYGHAELEQTRKLGAKYRVEDLVAESPELQSAIQVAHGCARTRSNVLLVGATGTWKELLYPKYPQCRKGSERAVCSGVWNKGEYSKAEGLYGNTLGIAGLGRIARELAKRAPGFGMQTVAWSRSLSAAGTAGDKAALRQAVTEKVVRVVTGYMGSGNAPNAVNRMEKTPAKYLVSVHHRNRVGVLASVLQVIKQHGINVDGMQNVLFQGGEGACANIQIESALSPEGLDAVTSAHGDIFSATMHEIP